MPIDEHRKQGPQDAGAGQSSPDTPTGPVGQPWRPADSSKQAIWEGSPAMELDFLPDSEIQDALEAPGFEAPPEQVRTSPIYSHMPQGTGRPQALPKRPIVGGKGARGDLFIQQMSPGV